MPPKPDRSRPPATAARLKEHLHPDDEHHAAARVGEATRVPQAQGGELQHGLQAHGAAALQRAPRPQPAPLLRDPSGRIIDLDKANSKLAIIDHEFRHAEKAEFWRQKEEAELRRRVQAKRFESLEKARFDERMAKVKEDRRIRKEIVTATLLATGQGQSTLTR